jgi:hypothetical protein
VKNDRCVSWWYLLLTGGWSQALTSPMTSRCTEPAENTTIPSYIRYGHVVSPLPDLNYANTLLPGLSMVLPSRMIILRAACVRSPPQSLAKIRPPGMVHGPPTHGGGASPIPLPTGRTGLQTSQRTSFVWTSRHKGACSAVVFVGVRASLGTGDSTLEILWSCCSCLRVLPVAHAEQGHLATSSTF